MDRPRRFTERLDCTKAFLHIAEQCPEFHEAIDIIRKNSEGNIYLIGGFVYRTIVQYIDNIPRPKESHLDFLVERIKEEPVIPDGWTQETIRYRRSRLVNGDKVINYLPLASIVNGNIESTIEAYFETTPLTIQSIAYDIQKQRVIGGIGTFAIQAKVVRVNYQEGAEYVAQMKGKTLHEYIQKYAEELDFLPRFPS